MSDVRVLVVDDQPVFRDVVASVIASTPGFELAGMGASGHDALAVAGALAPDLVLMDVRMPGIDGIEATRVLTARHPGLVVVLVSAHDVTGLRDLGRERGAAEVVAKERLRPELLLRLWREHGGRRAGTSR